jgi:acetyltransferase-like isoleucine patch superfamily enzyme
MCGAKIGRHVRLGWLSVVSGRRIEMGDYSEVRALSVIRCDGDVRIGAYSIVSNLVLVYGSASLVVGDHCYIGPQCLINVDEDVRMGNVSALGPRSLVFTHSAFLPYTEGYWRQVAGVTIGSHAWIAAGAFIHPGVEVGDDVFVNSMSVLRGAVPAGQAVEGCPAVRVADTASLRRRMSAKRVDLALQEMLGRFVEVVLRRRMGVDVQADALDRFSFHHHRRRYVLLCVPSDGVDLAGLDLADRPRLICLVNQPGWSAPPAAAPLVFDVPTMRTQFSRDRIHRKLWRFMRTYYGVTFEYR